MMDSNYTRDPERDPELAAALRAAAGPLPEVDFARLRGAVLAQAELPLARRRAEAARPAPRRLRTLLPLAAAAGIAAAALALGVPPLRQGTVPSEHDRAQVEQILNASDPGVRELVSADAQSQALLSAAIGS